MEKRKKNVSIDNKEQIKQKESTYMEKYKRSMKPKETFQSTTKNPKDRWRRRKEKDRWTKKKFRKKRWKEKWEK